MSPEYCQQTVRSRLDVRAAASLLRPTRHRDFLNSLRSRWSLPPADSGEKVQNDSDLLSPKKYVRFYLMIWVGNFNYLENFSSSDKACRRSLIVEQSTFFATAWRKKNLVDGRFTRNWTNLDKTRKKNHHIPYWLTFLLSTQSRLFPVWISVLYLIISGKITGI